MNENEENQKKSKKTTMKMMKISHYCDCVKSMNNSILDLTMTILVKKSRVSLNKSLLFTPISIFQGIIKKMMVKFMNWMKKNGKE